METYRCVEKSYSYDGDLMLDKAISISYTKKSSVIHVVDYIIKKEMLKKQLAKKLDRLMFLLKFYLESDDDSGVAYQEALNEINKFREILRNKYRKLMNEEMLESINNELLKYEILFKRKLHFLGQKVETVTKEGRRSK
ncbi:MAG: hypothetical protein PUB03_06245 [bacterium]|nr:hypothetical protein [bacterium]